MQINKLLIANRGEIAVRIAHTCRAMGVGTVAVFSDPDADAPHVRVCDEAIRIGGDTPATSYLRQDALIDAARRTGADAVHPGFGFLAENADFARAVIDAGLTWVGPTPDAIAAMGDKLAAKRLMADAGVPLLPSVEIGGDTDIAAAAGEVGYPLMVKAAAGGGGKGMRVVAGRDDLADAVAAAQREAAGAFGDDRVFLERFVERPRHIEVQVIGDTHGTILHLLERECSIQRRHQKVVEESPSPALDGDLRKRICEAAVDAARGIDYTNAGTVEFIFDDVTGDFAFLEMNTRLQVEHPVTEAITGLDLVRLQLLVASGHPLPLRQDEVHADGHAIEVRLYAEDPANDYLPATGTLQAFDPPADEAIRWDTGVERGSVVSTFYDPMLAKVIAHAPTRAEAATRLARVLDRTVLQGVVTNRDLLVRILRDPSYLAGDTTTRFLEERFPSREDRSFPPSADNAVRAAIVATLADAAAAATQRHLPGVPPGFSNVGLGAETTTYTVGGQEVAVAVSSNRDGTFVVQADDREIAASVWAADERRVTVELDGHRFAALVDQHHDSVQVVLPDANVTLYRHPRFPQRAVADDPGATLSPMPGAVVSVSVEEGQRVAAGDLLVVVEAMKMEHRIVANVDGVVSEVRVSAGQQVDADEVLVIVDPDEEGA